MAKVGRGGSRGGSPKKKQEGRQAWGPTITGKGPKPPGWKLPPGDLWGRGIIRGTKKRPGRAPDEDIRPVRGTKTRPLVEMPFFRLPPKPLSLKRLRPGDRPDMPGRKKPRGTGKAPSSPFKPPAKKQATAGGGRGGRK